MFLLGLDPTAVRTSAEGPAFALGTRGVAENGNEYVYVMADEAISATAVMFIESDFSVQNLGVSDSAPAVAQGLPVGLCVATLASGGYGWAQRYGIGDVEVQVNTSCAQHTILNTTGVNGELDDDGGVGSEVIDGLTTTAAESGGTAACILNYPIIGRTL